jgi:hypothetical protein
VDAVNTEYYDGLISALSPFESSGQGAISRFGRFNPIYRTNNPGLPGTAGITFEYKLSDQFLFQGGYTADRNSNDPSSKNGLFDGSNTVIGQLVFRPSKTFDVGVTYIRAYYAGNDVNLTGNTGSAYATNPFNGSALSADVFGAQAQWRVSKAFTVGGWYGNTMAYRKSNDDYANIQTWAVFLAFPDLGRKGNLGGLLVGQPPKLTDTRFRLTPTSLRRLDQDTTVQVEAFYRYRVTDNISVTPGFFVIINPEGNDANATQFVGTVRTTFTF